MSAKFVDALMGYEYFIERRGKASIDDVNVFLKKIARAPISKRTYTHYRSLMRYGFRSYFPINQFDVSRTLGQLPISPDRRRYSREKVNIEASISLDRNVWNSAIVNDRSIVGFGIDMPLGKLKLNKLDTIWIRTDQYVDIPTILVWKKVYNDKLRFGVRASGFISNYLISEKETIVSRPTRTFVVKKNSKDNITWEELQRITIKINEFIEATSALLYSVAEIANKKINLSPPIISSIHFASPGSARIKVDLDIAKVTKVVLEKFQYWGIDKKHRMEELRTKEIDNEEKIIKNNNLKIEGLRNAIRLRKEAIETGIPKEIAESIFQAAINTLGIEQMLIPTKIYKPGTLEYGIIMKRLLPAATELLAGDDPEIDVDVEEDPSD